MPTHTVTNQAAPREGIDEYAANLPLVEGVQRHGAAWAETELSATGALVGTAGFQHDAELANINEPVLHAFDRYGARIDEVEYHPAYHAIIGAALSAGAHTSAWADPRPGAQVARAAQFMLFAQVEPGHACPVSMTHAVVPALAAFAPAELREQWLPRLFSRSYAPRLSGDKASAVFGMAMTEKQGGSDVRANRTEAVPSSDGGYVLTGHKWFCSAPMSDAFLVLAQAPGGLSCFLVPRVLPDGERNPFFIQRLKDKLGNRANASSEVEFDGTRGWLVGDEGRGVRTIIEMVNQTRLDCLLGTTAGMRQSTAEAIWHAQHRAAFGALLSEQPAMTQVLADLAVETEAATATALRVAAAYEADAPEGEAAFARLATAVQKYWICKRGPGHAYEALECLGGNGYTEGFPLARRYREQPVMAVWEGSGNVIALDVLRALAREPESLDAYLDEVRTAQGASGTLDAFVAETETLARIVLADPSSTDAQARARALTERLAVALQASLLVRHAPDAVADAFCATRLTGRGFLYGAEPVGDAAAIVARHESAASPAVPGR
ncbi:acyl-CoA dehydrogenase family protein [Microbacterium pseudoresistens]|uniref:Putative acyl-CoA dehydrogenase n=1 Tax=Microbacterium pseudoresistens TaxID=640634 RepID=A0A7Y9JMT6_9MICO|nr:acyl-CoA dehydrogenase family protein [Microbacterium pseudoresistens]NYD54685.1 putative acyl-CoA dehydrogenase [Microbacterium pseudoresistens]